MSSEIAIKLQDVSKCYHIYGKPRDRLAQMFAGQRKKYYQEFWALRNISFEIKKGETVGIVGRNGSGKSTLLQVICGTLSQSSGDVATAGRIGALLELGSGFNPEFTGHENVYMNAAILGLSRAEVDERYDDIVAFADIGEFIHQPTKTYSSGMIVRLAFAVQAMIDPDILIVDEALAVGDERFQRKCFARLDELKAKGTSILFVSHSGPQVVEFCDRAILMERGEHICTATPMEVIRAYQKLIYAPAEEQPRLIEEFRSLGDSSAVVEVKEASEVSAEPVSIADEYYFDAAMVPDSTTVYPEQGARIDSFEIFDKQGRLCNVLQAGGDYDIVVSGILTESVSKVFLATHIRSVSGVVITGQRFPEEGKYFELERGEQSFRITFGFKMVMLPGVYFVGGGVWSETEPSCSHRILDALMFRLVSDQGVRSFGYMDASNNEPVLELL
ncbi:MULTISPECIES: ABC transporter ATP-binding protein [Pseudomonas]|uniref:Teichoic acids export ATP-binding protein TagH n=1 Tax=Pseudomonas frederiksbergensis TaxID=104087 RepID=A0A6L5BRN7_9PSED|nr:MULTISPECIES: ABC transporter ATP-binding protein [Pseudomonas]KAF2391003.1 Teichoic acids export ATP-binding protein TagH [Pseudomonas frederiksbergensis]MDN3220505.1 ABC transporter ATP-binding protein [Pseudomonas nunensis]UZE10332.1 ABC transporter ATP-binding protein [Pseudomonas sp. B21-053]